MSKLKNSVRMRIINYGEKEFNWVLLDDELATNIQSPKVMWIYRLVPQTI